MNFFDTFPNEKTVLPANQVLTPFATCQALRGLEGSDHRVPLGDGLQLMDLLVCLTTLPSPTDMMITGRIFIFVLSAWRLQEDRPLLHEVSVREELSKLATVLKWLSGTVPAATTVDAVAASVGRHTLMELSVGFRRVSDAIEVECETRPRIVRWVSTLPWWLVLPKAFRPWVVELHRVLGAPEERSGTSV